MSATRTAIRIGGLTLMLILLAGCWPCTNPVDSMSDSYQGYPTVRDPNEVTPVEPADGTETVWPPVLVTAEIPGGTYVFDVATDPAFLAGLIVNAEVEAENRCDLAEVAVTPTVPYYWRVTATSPEGVAGVPSAPYTFTPALPYAIDTQTPVNGGSLYLANPLLDWPDVEGAVGYEVQMAVDSWGLDTAELWIAPTSEYTVSGLLDGDVRVWRARGVDGNGRHTYWGSASAFTATDAVVESFEGGVLPVGWSGDWWVTNYFWYDGGHCLESADIADSGYTQIVATVSVLQASTLSFYYYVSSESGCDYLRFYIDGWEQASWSGETGWQYASYSVAAGSHTLLWSYSKDFSVSTGSDCAWIDLLQIQ